MVAVDERVSSSGSGYGCGGDGDNGVLRMNDIISIPCFAFSSDTKGLQASSHHDGDCMKGMEVQIKNCRRCTGSSFRYRKE